MRHADVPRLARLSRASLLVKTPISHLREREGDRFEGLGFKRGDNGMAVLDDALGYVECKVSARHRAGDHDIVVGEVEVAVADEGKPLLYYRGGYAQLER